MKYCPYCGAGLDEDFAFCPKCGKPFESEKENPNLAGKSVAQEASPAAAAVPVSPSVDESPKKKKRGGLIAVIAGAVVLAIVGGLFASGAFAPKEEPVVPFSDNTDAIAQASKSVVMLTCYDKDGEPYATGSGFAVFDEGVIVTNYHVIEQEVYRVKAQVEGGISFECPTVLAFDADKDIAILKADRDTGLTLLPIGSANNLQKGEKVVAIGSPLGLMNSVSTGVFSGYIEDKAGSMLQFTAPISHGSSGGALFNNAGEVIGITFATLTEGQSLNLGVPIDDVKALYDYAGSQKAMSIEAFYDTFDHTPPLQTYTVGYVLSHYEELDGQEFFMEGYIQTIWKYENDAGQKEAALFMNDNKNEDGSIVDSCDSARMSSYDFALMDVDRAWVKQYYYARVIVPFENRYIDWLNNKVLVQCQLSVLEKADGVKLSGGERLFFTPFAVELIE